MSTLKQQLLAWAEATDKNKGNPFGIGYYGNCVEALDLYIYKDKPFDEGLIQAEDAGCAVLLLLFLAEAV